MLFRWQKGRKRENEQNVHGGVVDEGVVELIVTVVVILFGPRTKREERNVFRAVQHLDFK